MSFIILHYYCILCEYICRNVNLCCRNPYEIWLPSLLCWQEEDIEIQLRKQIRLLGNTRAAFAHKSLNKLIMISFKCENSEYLWFCILQETHVRVNTIFKSLIKVSPLRNKIKWIYMLKAYGLNYILQQLKISSQSILANEIQNNFVNGGKSTRLRYFNIQDLIFVSFACKSKSYEFLGKKTSTRTWGTLKGLGVGFKT